MQALMLVLQGDGRRAARPQDPDRAAHPRPFPGG
jgi:hypothetical protein